MESRKTQVEIHRDGLGILKKTRESTIGEHKNKPCAMGETESRTESMQHNAGSDKRKTSTQADTDVNWRWN